MLTLDWWSNFPFNYFISLSELTVVDNPLERVLSKNLYKLSKDEQRIFFKYKESQYEQRRQQVHRVCQRGIQILPKCPPEKMVAENMMYSSRYQITYCMIPKVASSTWCNHFLSLAELNHTMRSKYAEAVQSKKNYLRVFEECGIEGVRSRG